MTTEPTDPERWREQLHELAARIVQMMAVDYPGMARLAMAHIPVGDNSLRVVESMLSLLKAGGVSDQAAAYAADLIGSYTTAIAYEQSLYAALYNDPEHVEREVGRIAERFAGLSPERYPTIAALREQDDHGRRRGALLARPRRDHQRPARDADRGSAEPRGLGAAVVSEQWFVVNVGDADWESKGEFGVRTRFESPDDRFAHFGITVQVLQPGQPSGLYHAEEAQEGFLVLAGECLAVIDGQEHPLRQWDYFHCPPGDRGTSSSGRATGRARCSWSGAPRSASLSEILYPQDPVAARHGASVDRDDALLQAGLRRPHVHRSAVSRAVARRLTRAV